MIVFKCDIKIKENYNGFFYVLFKKMIIIEVKSYWIILKNKEVYKIIDIKYRWVKWELWII